MMRILWVRRLPTVTTTLQANKYTNPQFLCGCNIKFFLLKILILNEYWILIIEYFYHELITNDP